MLFVQVMFILKPPQLKPLWSQNLSGVCLAPAPADLPG